jgi:hypothetical protein
VRNNAVRALGVLASAKDTGGITVDPTPFIALLYSGHWTDRNKSSLLLAQQLKRSRDPILLKALRDKALPPLIEGARWGDPGHSIVFLDILGCIEGVPDAELNLNRKPGIIEAAEKALQEEHR